MPLSPNQLTQIHRRQQLALRKVTLDEMARLWPALDWARLDATYPEFAGAVTEVVAKNRRTSTGLASAYLRAYRVASGLDGDVRIIIPPAVNLPQLDASLHSTAVGTAKKAAARAVAPSLAMQNALTIASGAVARLVLDAGRETMLASLRSDDKARGYRRIVGSGACDFCTTVGGSGSRVYNVDANFDVHDKCGCTSEPVYD